MNDEELIKAAIEDLIVNHAIDNSKYYLVTDANNLVVEVDSKILKIYRPGISTVPDLELSLYGKIKSPGLYKKVLFAGQFGVHGKEYSYGLFEKVLGKTIDTVDYRDENLAFKISQTMYDYINDVARIEFTGCGYINQKFEGRYTDFYSFLSELIHKTSVTLHSGARTGEYADIGFKLLSDNAEVINRLHSQIIPVDFNFKNFMLTAYDKIIIIDPGAVIAGPVEMAYGEVMAHSFGTPVFVNFKKRLNGQNEKTIRFFAVISLLDLLAYIIKQGKDPVAAKPFGNPNTCFELLNEHLIFLES